MRIIFGIIYHTLGGVASGSFYMPFNKVKGWSWETYWIIGGLFSWLIVPMLVAYITIPGFMDIISAASSKIIFLTFLMGLMWGIGGLSYGLGVRYLGMSLGNTITLGFCAAFGAIIPSVYYSFHPVAGRVSFTDMLSTSGGLMVLGGVLVCLAGIAICGKAGMMKEKELSPEEQKKSIKEFNLVKGLVIAVLSGILSSFFNFGIETGTSMADKAVELGHNPLFQNNVTFVVILWGGLTTNFIWTAILTLKNKTYGDFVNTSTPIASNVLFSAMAGTTWFFQFFFYGMGESKLGNGASSWILHMSTIILTANFWGIYRKEWSNVSTRTKRTIITGILIMLISVAIVGFGNTML